RTWAGPFLDLFMPPNWPRGTTLVNGLRISWIGSQIFSSPARKSLSRKYTAQRNPLRNVLLQKRQNRTTKKRLTVFWTKYAKAVMRVLPKKKRIFCLRPAKTSD